MVTNESQPKTSAAYTRYVGGAILLLIIALIIVSATRKPQVKQNSAPGTAPMAVAPATVASPNSPAELNRLAEQESKPILEKLKSDPKNPESLAKLGDLKFDAGQYKDAITYYEQSLAVDPKNTRVRADMANAYAYTGDPDRAIAEYQKALTYDPKHGLSLLNLGLVKWHDKGDVPGAVSAWETLVKVNPEFAKQVQVETLIAKAKEHAKMKMPASPAK